MPILWVLLFLWLKPLVIAIAIGMVSSAILYRSRLTPGLYLGSIALSIVGYIAGANLTDWASDHAEFVDDKRIDIASWGEHLRLRNRIAENERVVTIAVAIAPILILYLVKRWQWKNSASARNNLASDSK